MEAAGGGGQGPHRAVEPSVQFSLVQFSSVAKFAV
jgi:hypothetical protein